MYEVLKNIVKIYTAISQKRTLMYEVKKTIKESLKLERILLFLKYR